MIVESENAGYSKMPISQSRAYAVRVALEPNVEVKEGLDLTLGQPRGGVGGFFPAKKVRKARLEEQMESDPLRHI